MDYVQIRMSDARRETNLYATPDCALSGLSHAPVAAAVRSMHSSEVVVTCLNTTWRRMPRYVYRCASCKATRGLHYPTGGAPRVLVDRCDHHDDYVVEFQRVGLHSEERTVPR